MKPKKKEENGDNNKKDDINELPYTKAIKEDKRNTVNLKFYIL